ncbi:hypothetical protein G6F57_008230 [Rhizopus arrhizus]|uniref:Uncharacterized protein n=1 Tax=Rhizopus oryzae TaxID=64495 RepID=A0A9P6X9N4_RHIOR|nr:hypothetical protein G6F23_003214 [Rhizopus arrhizus]KAG1426530.1 hypothetical protein G6F58_001443 [Rhizopus delemar]KAG0787182.1 hypothetical protein G6F21_008079 [Rhizopus arrhizus]KAG0800882.1 hypothetical protein G6F22_001793 [Rhizopus arrhizus]KAG0809447.1 hypothetical protein G6F20_008769 [Rhizopus arrhizus]
MIPTSSSEADSSPPNNNSIINNSIFYMGNKNTVNHVINNNGKRVANQDDPFNQPGVENSEFFNKILKTHHEEGNPPNNETEVEEVKNDVLDVEDDSIFQEEIAYENGESEELLAIADSVKLWKATEEYQPLIHKQDLLHYNIIDTSLDDIPQLTNNRLEFIKSLKTAAYQTPHPIAAPRSKLCQLLYLFRPSIILQ